MLDNMLALMLPNLLKGLGITESDIEKMKTDLHNFASAAQAVTANQLAMHESQQILIAEFRQLRDALDKDRANVEYPYALGVLSLEQIITPHPTPDAPLLLTDEKELNGHAH